jgi:hypothetical protein
MTEVRIPLDPPVQNKSGSVLPPEIRRDLDLDPLTTLAIVRNVPPHFQARENMQFAVRESPNMELKGLAELSGSSPLVASDDEARRLRTARFHFDESVDLRRPVSSVRQNVVAETIV